MKDVLELVEKTLGPGTLPLVAVAVLLYFAAIGIAKVIEVTKGLSLHKARLDSEKTRLEISKLQYEIAALRKTHDLPELPPTPGVLASDTTHVVMAPLALGASAIQRIVHGGALGRAFLYAGMTLLVLSGWLATGLFISALRYRLAGNPFTAGEIYATVAAGIIAPGFLAIAILQLGRKLQEHSRLTVRTIYIVSFIVAAAATGYALSIQTV